MLPSSGSCATTRVRVVATGWPRVGRAEALVSAIRAFFVLFCQPPYEREHVFVASPPCSEFSSLSRKSQKELVLPHMTPSGQAFEDISWHIDGRAPDTFVGAQSDSVRRPYKRSLATTDEANRFITEYPAPLDYILRGVTKEGRRVGFEHKTDRYNVVYWSAGPRQFLNPQPRKRVWFVLAKKEICDERSWTYVLHVAKEALRSEPDDYVRLGEILDYVAGSLSSDASQWQCYPRTRRTRATPSFKRTLVQAYTAHSARLPSHGLQARLGQVKGRGLADSDTMKVDFVRQCAFEAGPRNSRTRQTARPRARSLVPTMQ